MIFENIILSDICEIIDCEHKTAPTQEDGFPLIRTPNIGNGVLKLENVQRISQETYLKWTKRAIPQPNDLIMAREAPVGNVAIIPKGQKVCLGQRTVLIRVKSEKVEPKYLNYLLNSDGMHAYLNILSNGATVGHLNVTDIRNLKLPALPSIKVQKKIAAILSAYDDLIENNKHRIALLENMAEEIYREWFVRFRFPGYQTAEFEKGIPKGWKINSIKNIVDRKGFGKIYRAEDLTSEGDVIVIDQSRNDFLGFYDGEPQHKASYENPMILFGDHTCKMVLVHRDFSLAENVIPFSPKDGIPVHFLFHLIKEKAKQTEYKRHWTELTTQNVLIPSEVLQGKFSKKVIDIYQMIERLKSIISNLTSSRDKLLPRLISGKLSVEDLDIQFPPSMQEDSAA
jgi:type I restriction enzyme S subunit